MMHFTSLKLQGTCMLVPRQSLGHGSRMSPQLKRPRIPQECAAAAAAAASDTRPARHDLAGLPNIPVPANSAQALVPTYGGSPVSITYRLQSVPKLDQATIQKVKAAAQSKLSGDVQAKIKALQTVNSSSGFVHPGGVVSAAELALMQDRLARSAQATTLAKQQLLSGDYHAYQADLAKPKLFVGKDGTKYQIPTDCPATGYGGPYPAVNVSIGYNGRTDPKQGTCPPNLPPDALKAATLPGPEGYTRCQHIAFVELDAMMAYKQALAFHATGDERYAKTAMNIIAAWAETNKSWGLIGQNGPLEAGWGIASMAKALELLRNRSRFPEVRAKFLKWVNGDSSSKGIMMQQMDHYINDSLTKLQNGQAKNLFGNWHSSIVEAMMAVAVLADDPVRYNKAKEVFHITVKEYLWKWGREPGYTEGRLIGEITETYRDLFHSQFGLGGLIQTAEMAWQQNEDLYSSNEYAIVTAMEFHARIIRTALEKNIGLMPPEFKFLEFNKPPFDMAPYSAWQFDIRDQVWKYTKDGKLFTLSDPTKFINGAGFLSAAWEVGYNHYAGRLGMALPETAAILKLCWPEWLDFHWGLGSLTHADSASLLWRTGLTPTAS